MQKAWSNNQIERLLSAEDPRTFLRSAIEERAAEGRKLSFSNLARMAGFSSRSYPRDVILAKKFLTTASAASFAKALKLNVDVAHFFSLLVERDNLSRAKSGVKSATNLAATEKQLGIVARRIRRKISATARDGNQVYSIANASVVYASLGAPERGSTTEEIVQRSQMPAETVLLTLTRLCEVGLAKVENGRYFPLANHVAIENMKQNGDFQRIYIDRLKTAIRRAENQFDSTQNLFLESTFSISKENMPQLKSELRELLSRFVEEREIAEGSTVASLACAFFSPTGN